MKVLSIANDRLVYKEGSAVRARMTDYGSLVDELHIITFSRKKHALSPQKIGNNVFLYPTHSRTKLGAILGALRIGRQLLRNLGEDTIITTQDPFETGLVGMRLARQFKRKLQVQVHVDFLSPYFVAESFMNKVRGFMAYSVLPKAAQIRVVSERIKRSLEARMKISKEKIIVLPIFVDAEKIRTTPVTIDLHKTYPQFEKIILMVSRLEREKNIPAAIAAFARVREKFPKTGLLIVGSGSKEKALRELVQRFSLTNNVVFLGWNDNPITYYKTADIFLNTSLYEGYGMSLIEAAVCGLPIVTTSVGVAGDRIKHNQNGAICPVTDGDCLVLSLLRLLSDPNLALRQSEENRKATFVELDKAGYLEAYGRMWKSLF